MTGSYIHMTQNDLEKQVIVDAGVPVPEADSASGPRTPTPAEALALALNTFPAEAVRQTQP